MNIFDRSTKVPEELFEKLGPTRDPYMLVGASLLFTYLMYDAAFIYSYNGIVTALHSKSVLSLEFSHEHWAPMFLCTMLLNY